MTNKDAINIFCPDIRNKKGNVVVITKCVGVAKDINGRYTGFAKRKGARTWIFFWGDVYGTDSFNTSYYDDNSRCGRYNSFMKRVGNSCDNYEFVGAMSDIQSPIKTWLSYKDMMEKVVFIKENTYKGIRNV